MKYRIGDRVVVYGKTKTVAAVGPPTPYQTYSLVGDGEITTYDYAEAEIDGLTLSTFPTCRTLLQGVYKTLQELPYDPWEAQAAILVGAAIGCLESSEKAKG